MENQLPKFEEFQDNYPWLFDENTHYKAVVLGEEFEYDAFRGIQSRIADLRVEIEITSSSKKKTARCSIQLPPNEAKEFISHLEKWSSDYE